MAAGTTTKKGTRSATHNGLLSGRRRIAATHTNRTAVRAATEPDKLFDKYVHTAAGDGFVIGFQRVRDTNTSKIKKLYTVLLDDGRVARVFREEIQKGESKPSTKKAAA